MKDSTWLLDKLHDPASLEVADQAELREIIAEYPYFALPYLLLARQMHQHNHPAYDQLLPVISLRAQDRKKLFRLVHELETQPAPKAKPPHESLEPPVEVGQTEEPNPSSNEPEEAIQDEVQETNAEPIETSPGEPESDTLPDVEESARFVEDEPQEEEQLEESAKRSRFVLESNEITHDHEEREARDETEEELGQQELAEIPFGKARTQQEEPESEEDLEEESRPRSENSEETIQDEVSDLEPTDTIMSKPEPENLPQVEGSDSPVEEDSIVDREEESRITQTPADEESLKEQENESQIGNFFSWLDKFDHLKAEHGSEMRETRSESEEAQEGERREARDESQDEKRETRSENDDEAVSEVEQEPELDEQLSIIDEFIEKQPSISRIQGEFFDPASYAKESERMQDDMITETIARIFVQQEKYQKALDAYKKLQLKYPEKKAYFAALISEINEKIK